MGFQSKLSQWLILFLLAFIWGSSFILMKRGLEVYNYWQVAVIRMFVAFLALLPFVFKAIKRVPKDKWLYILGVGLFGNGIPAFLFTKAQTELSSSLTGMLNSLVPVFTLIIGFIIFHTKPSFIKIGGVILGFIGAAGLIYFSGENSANANGNILYTLFVIAATMCYAISLNIIKYRLSAINSMDITALAFSSIALPMAILFFYFKVPQTTIEHPQAIQALKYLLILSVIGTAFAVIIFNILIKNSSALFASSVTYIIPIVAVFWGILDNEPVNLLQILFMFVILSGVYLINTSKENKPKLDLLK
jgi:drug/metabolite transporter (DMT)-like permease